MKVVYKTVLDKIENEIKLHTDNGQNVIKYFAVTPEEFKEFITDSRVLGNIATQMIQAGASFPLDICGRCITSYGSTKKRCVVYHRKGVDWLVVEENS